jgi:hypothetical protein
MAKIWVLDTETKGTGAQMVPLETTQKAPGPRFARGYVPRARRAQPPAPPKPKPPTRFKVVDMMSRETLAEDVGARPTIDLLKGVRSVVDVDVYKWEHGPERWRRLTLGEQKSLWALRGR